MSNVLQGHQLETKTPCNVCFDLNIHEPDRAIEYLGRNPYDGRPNWNPMFIIRVDPLKAAAGAGCLSCELLKKVWDIISHDSGDIPDVSEFSICADQSVVAGHIHREFQVILPQYRTRCRTWVIQPEPGTNCRIQIQSLKRSSCADELRLTILE